ncbi:energy-coupling factor ABC transporter ATP-binding protein [Pseudothermotoga lettingae]|jgi:energy-coupling factor transport system ATP-binding protein|uniref:ABC transporter related n=1 Tax=Pseudothermotoga lettingae (strain ATCC BAA-301 / DSM 14385 / NBRC 107922 / TMO) TaxID=416591 RepID=A8F738_PSELT|nr:ABC transporter ATP-binding protein [Pseudothermotoga lettingae]ABV33972.1 ABC transporter related [Pseudothermotoga lettingae TMO]GLI49090.1 energy-coupling factor transporter ATP-binding protein EcfA [Pseudothermotoga lettingae TMO]
MFQLNLKNIDFSYDSSRKILQKVNMEISQGDFIAITGRSGSGKTTLLKIMAGILNPSSGTVVINGQPIKKDEHYYQKIGYVMQYAEDQFCCETVFEEIAFASKNFGLNGIKARVEKAASFVGLDKKILLRNPFDLSGGEARKVAIASAIAHDPFFLFLDEPFSGLDKLGKENLKKILSKWKDSKKPVVITSHNLKYIHDFTNKIFLLEDGFLTQKLMM